MRSWYWTARHAWVLEVRLLSGRLRPGLSAELPGGAYRVAAVETVEYRQFGESFPTLLIQAPAAAPLSALAGRTLALTEGQAEPDEGAPPPAPA